MKWNKQGKIFDANTFGIEWFKLNAMVPLPYLIDSNRLRLYVGMCDSQNISRIGYVDVDPMNPSKIIEVSNKPLIDIGEDGTFDDNGVVPASLLRDGDRLYMFYSGYQTCVKVPYLIFTGVAVSLDNGKSFKKISSQVPILDRIEGEAGTRCVPFVIKEGGCYKMWYTADSGKGWIDGSEKKLPLYDLKYAESESPVNWPNKPGMVAVPFKNADEHGIAKCTLWKDADIYKIIYSIRSISKQYRLGYGESADGISFVRKDDEVGIDVSSEGWDSEMIAFAERIVCGDKTYLFYCGNHYGRGGVGYAELMQE